MNLFVRSLEKLARRYRSLEAEVVWAFLRKRRDKESHIRWLKAQAFKEYSAIKPLVAALMKLHPYIDKEVDRHQYEELGEKLADETKHARLIMDLLEEISDKKITPKDLLWLAEDKRLARIRARYSRTYAGFLHGSESPTLREIKRKDEELERAAITLTEGGGGALYQVCRKMNGGKIERKIAAVFNEIYLDEMRHKNAGAQALQRLIKTKRDYERAARIIRSVSGQRLRMRNEQFGYPISRRTVQKIRAELARSLQT